MCKHNNFKHQIFISCCQRYFDCTYCHREFHQGDNVVNKIENIKCNKCNKTQLLKSNNCIHCNTQFANEFCSMCGIWCNESLTHCYKCNICYIYKADKLKHCSTCNHCYDINSFTYHKCSMKNNNCECQICFEKIIYSFKKYKFLKCNHTIHYDCYDEYKKVCDKGNKIMTCGICREKI